MPFCSEENPGGGPGRTPCEPQPPTAPVHHDLGNLLGQLPSEEQLAVSEVRENAQVLPFPVRYQLREIIFLNEPEAIAAEEQPKRWFSKTGDMYWSGIRALTKTSGGLD